MGLMNKKEALSRLETMKADSNRYISDIVLNEESKKILKKHNQELVDYIKEHLT